MLALSLDPGNGRSVASGRRAPDETSSLPLASAREGAYARATVLIAAIVLTLLMATGAHASTVSVVDAEHGREVVFTAAPGELNDVALRWRSNAPNPPVKEISDSGSVVTPGAGCVSIDAHTVRCEGGLDRVMLDDGDDRLTVAGSLAGSVIASGGPGDDQLSGSTREDELDGGPGRDDLRGRAGYDLLAGGADADVVDGGSGRDRISYADHTEAVFVDLGRRRGQGASQEGDRIQGVESVVGGAGDDVLKGDEDGNDLDGGPGADRLFGREGSDLLSGGDARTSCGPGDDMIDVPTGEYLDADCEHIRSDPDTPALTVQPAVVVRRWLGWRFWCPFVSDFTTRECRPRLRVVAQGGKLVARGALRLDDHLDVLLKAGLTRLGRRLLAERARLRVTIELSGRDVPPASWRIMLRA
jgi:Ca2+-binding RTX toxin-like protein